MIIGFEREGNRMNIIPISTGVPGVAPVGGGPNVAAPGQNVTKSFTDYLKDAVQEIDTLDQIKTEDAYNLAIGNVDDLAAVQNNGLKYELAVQLVVQMRNKLLDSYSEIMRMNI